MSRHTHISTLALELAAVADGKAPQRIKLFGIGGNAAADGRFFDVVDPQAIVKASKGRSTKMVIDYEHSTDLRAKAGGEAPAAGWIQELIAEDDGIYAEVEWTERAASMIAAREYRYISPTFMADKKTGEVRLIKRAALTNDPALDLPALASAQEPTLDEEKSGMDENLKKFLCSLLGLDPETASDEDITTAASAAEGGVFVPKDKVAELASTLKIDGDATVETILASAKDHQVDLGKFAPMEVVTTLQGQVTELTNQLASVQEASIKSEREAKLNQAVKDGLVAPGLKDWALNLASVNPEAFDQFLANTPKVITPGEPTKPGNSETKGEHGLTETELQVCSLTGQDPAVFAKMKTEGK